MMPLTDQERAELEALNSGQLSDAMEALNLRRSVVTGFMMLAAPGSKIVGTAVTLRQIPKNASEDREARLTRHQDLSRKIAQKGEVVVVDNGGRLDTATWGEFHTYACKQNGVAGAIIDGATRDGPEIRSSGFPTLVRDLTPVSSKWDLKTASIPTPSIPNGSSTRSRRSQSAGRASLQPGGHVVAEPRPSADGYDEKSDEVVVPTKRPNKGRQLSAEVVEGRASPKGNSRQAAVVRTLSRVATSIRLAVVCRTACGLKPQTASENVVARNFNLVDHSAAWGRSASPYIRPAGWPVRARGRSPD